MAPPLHAVHPNADRLFIATMDIDTGKSVPVIFGGTRLLSAGDMVAVALPGTRLPDGQKIRPRNWRGIKSHGELLSSDELGWTVNGPDEVALLEPTECRPGQSLAALTVQHALAMYLPDTPHTVSYMRLFCRVHST